MTLPCDRAPLACLSGLVYIIDDDLSMREALDSLIRAAGGEVRLFASAQEYLRAPPPDSVACLVLDVHMPGLSGLELQQMMHNSPHQRPVIFITGQGTIPMAVRAMKAGAVEFLSKPFEEAELLTAIQNALDKDRQVRRDVIERTALQAQFARLTPRERDVVTMLGRRLLNKQAAAELGMSEMTVKVHRHNIMRKLNARTVAELVTMMERGGLMDQPPAV